MGSFPECAKSSLTAIIPLLPAWLESAIEESKREDDRDEGWTVQLLNREARTTLWNMCRIFHASDDGIPGQACRLLERYISAQSRHYSSLNIGALEWQLIKMRMSAQMPRAFATCIQLASKMNNRKRYCDTKMIHRYLQSYDAELSIKAITDFEFTVYKELEFRIPLWTSVQLAEALALMIGMPHSLLRNIALLVNYAEYKRVELDELVRNAVVGLTHCVNSHAHPMTLRTLHLAAACVCAITKDKHSDCYKGPNPLGKLAQMVQVSMCYLHCVSNIIFQHVLLDYPCTCSKQAKKRSLETDTNQSPTKEKQAKLQ
ncbi:hypothetical protein ACJJTC_018753 [Scirpophaga incertulas]